MFVVRKFLVGQEIRVGRRVWGFGFRIRRRLFGVFVGVFFYYQVRGSFQRCRRFVDVCWFVGYIVFLGGCRVLGFFVRDGKGCFCFRMIVFQSFVFYEGGSVGVVKVQLGYSKWWGQQVEQQSGIGSFFLDMCVISVRCFYFVVVGWRAGD